jgi:N-succinyldiaminopimelate aminotransferase
MPTFAKRVADFGTSIFAEMNDYASNYSSVNLGQGRPDFDGPREMLEAASEAILSGKANQYAPDLGILPLRQQVVLHAKKYYDLDVDVDKGIVVTSGASEGLFTAIQGAADAGDEIILIEPFFDLYLPAATMGGMKPVFVPMRPPSWTFDPDELRAAFNKNTRAIVINNPHNPTGRVYTTEELTLVADLAKEFDVTVISDEVYEHLTYDGARHIPIATLPDMFERTLTVSSAAKTFSATGWKVGWVYGHPNLITGVWRVHQNVTFAVNHPGQWGVAKAFTLGDAYYEEVNQMYLGKRQIVLDGLANAGIKVTYTPNGAFYVMGDFSDVYDGNDMEFAQWLIREHGVTCIPPSPFFSEPHKYLARKHARFSYCMVDETLHKAAARLAKLRS